MGAGKKILMGAGIATLAAAAAGAYLLYGSDARKKKRKEIKAWMQSAKADVMKKMESVKEMNEEIYNTIVNEVVAKYKALKEVDTTEMEELSKHFRDQWKHIKKALETKPKK